MNTTVAIPESMPVHTSIWVLKQSCITDYMKQEQMFLANIDVRLWRSRIYMFLHWYVYLTFEKYNSNYSFIIVVYFSGRIIGVLLYNKKTRSIWCAVAYLVLIESNGDWNIVAMRKVKRFHYSKRLFHLSRV